MHEKKTEMMSATKSPENVFVPSKSSVNASCCARIEADRTSDSLNLMVLSFIDENSKACPRPRG